MILYWVVITILGIGLAIQASATVDTSNSINKLRAELESETEVLWSEVKSRESCRNRYSFCASPTTLGEYVDLLDEKIDAILKEMDMEYVPAKEVYEPSKLQEPEEPDPAPIQINRTQDILLMPGYDSYNLIPVQ